MNMVCLGESRSHSLRKKGNSPLRRSPFNVEMRRTKKVDKEAATENMEFDEENMSDCKDHIVAGHQLANAPGLWC